jgi:hypothetical protein
MANELDGNRGQIEIERNGFNGLTVMNEIQVANSKAHKPLLAGQVLWRSH